MSLMPIFAAMRALFFLIHIFIYARAMLLPAPYFSRYAYATPLTQRRLRVVAAIVAAITPLMLIIAAAIHIIFA